jgi:hypothetical protein
MSFADVRHLLAARAATDPDATKLLEIFLKADETLREPLLHRIEDIKFPYAEGA